MAFDSCLIIIFNGKQRSLLCVKTLLSMLLLLAFSNFPFILLILVQSWPFFVLVARAQKSPFYEQVSQFLTNEAQTW